MAGFLNWGFGPKVPFYLMGALNLAGAVLMVMMPSLENGEEPAAPAPAAQPPAKPAVSAASWGAFGILLISMMLGGITYRGTTVTLPAYLELNSEGVVAFLTGLLPTGITPNLVATTTAALVYLAGMVGQLVCGRVGDKHDIRWVYFFFHLCSLPAVFLMAYLSDLPLALAAIFYVFFLLGMQPAENTLVAKLTPESLRHSAFGAKFVLTFGVGALAVQLAAGIKAAWSMSAIFLVLSGLTAPLLLAILALRKKTEATLGKGA